MGFRWLQVPRIEHFVFDLFCACERRIAGVVAGDDARACASSPGDASAWELVSIAARLAASLCTDADAAKPLARSAELAHSVLVILEQLPQAGRDADALALASFVCNVSSYSQVSALPSFDCPEAGGNAFLELPPDPVFRLVTRLAASSHAGAAATAAKMAAHFVRIPGSADHAFACGAAATMVGMLASQHIDAATAAADALCNLADDASSCAQLVKADLGATLATALLSATAALQRCEPASQAQRARSGRVAALPLAQVPEQEEADRSDWLASCTGLVHALLQLLVCVLRWRSRAASDDLPQAAEVAGNDAKAQKVDGSGFGFELDAGFWDSLSGKFSALETLLGSRWLHKALDADWAAQLARALQQVSEALKAAQQGGGIRTAAATSLVLERSMPSH